VALSRQLYLRSGASARRQQFVWLVVKLVIKLVVGRATLTNV